MFVCEFDDDVVEDEMVGFVVCGVVDVGVCGGIVCVSVEY